MRPSTKKLLSTAVLAAILSACGGGGGGGSQSTGPDAPDPSPGPSAIDGAYQGLWIAEAYGRVVDIGGNRLRMLDYSSEFCLQAIDESDVDTGDVESLFRLSGDALLEFGSNGTASFSAPATRYDKAQALPASCAQGLTPMAGDAQYQRDPVRDLRLFAQLLDEYSIYPALRGVEVSGLLAEQSALLTQDSSDEALLEALYQLALPFGDIHTSVESDEALVKVFNKTPLDFRLADEWMELESVQPPLTLSQVGAVNRYIGEERARDRAVTLDYAESEGDIRRAAKDLLTWYVADGIGYLAIDAMTGFGDVEDNADELARLEAALDAALGDLRDVQALIVDVRRNGGGKDFLSLAIASRFAANETLAYRKQARLGSARSESVDVFLSPRGSLQYLGPVFLLTSAHTASGAEVFTLAMRALPQVTLVGEATQGGLSDQLDKQLSNGWKASVANEFYLSAEGEWFEGAGIPVHVEVPQFDRGARLAGVDPGLEAVIELLAQ